MPHLSIRLIRVSLIYLALGFTLGAALLTNKALVLYPPTWRMLPIHIELLMIGWFVQLAMGVAYWILPRLPGPAPRGPQSLVWLAIWLVNAGIGLVIIEALISVKELLLIGRLTELAGALAFVAAIWPRVKAFGRS